MTEQQITSTRNPRVMAAAALRERRHRDRSGQMLIDGVREFGRALDAGIAVAEVFLCDELLTPHNARLVRTRLAAVGVVPLSVARHVFAKLAFGDRAEGIVAVATIPRRRLEDLRLADRPLVAVIENCEKPGNLGAVLRSADAAGVSAVIVADGQTDLYNPNVIRASLGTVFSLPTATASTAEALSFLRKGGFRIVAARVDAAADYTTADFTGAVAIALGSEAVGLSAAWTADDIAGVRLPMCGVADSLNLSATAAVLFYEALRQRR